MQQDVPMSPPPATQQHQQEWVSLRGRNDWRALPGHGQMRRAKRQRLALTAANLRWRDCEADGWQPGEQRLPEHLQFHAGDLLSQASVNAAPEAQDRLYFLIKVNSMGLGKHGGIVVGGMRHEEEYFFGRNSHLTQQDGFSGDA